MNPIALQLGPISIRWYAICIVTGVILAVYLSMKEAPRKRINPDDIIDFILIAFPLAIIGARLYYVIFEWGYYSQHPAEIFAVWNGGIAIYGGLLTGALVLYLFSHRRMIDTIDFLDIAAPSVMIAQSIGRWGNFTNQEAHGEAVTRAFLEGLHLPNFIIEQMHIDGVYYHPTFLYESLWSFVGVLILFYLRRRKGVKVGEIMSGYLLWYSFGRFFIEGMRTDSLWMFGIIRISQLVSIVLFLLGIAIIVVRRRRVPAVPDYVSIDDPQSPALFGKA